MVEPYNLSLAEIGRLTDWQIRWILFPPRDEQGHPLSQADVATIAEAERDDADTPAEWAGYANYKEQFFGVWRLRKTPEEEIKRKWIEYLKTDPQEAAAEKEREKKRAS